MQPIIATIHPGETGPHVANLQDALIALLGLTPEELETLSVDLRQERARSTFGEATYKLVVTFQVQQVLNDNLRGVVEDTTAAKINELLKFFGVLDEDILLIVRGTVKTADDQPLRGAIVRAFDRDLRKEQPLGDAETNERGEYSISYGPANFASGDLPSAPTPKLIVRAFVGDQQIGDDVARPNPERDEVVNFKTPAPVVSEWEKLTIGVMPLLKGQGKDDQTLPPWEINDSDLNFIAQETGLDREHIRLWALAFAVGRDALEMQPAGPIRTGPMTHLPVTGTAGDLSTFAIFYGWFRLGLPSEPVALWATPTETLLSTLRNAITQGIVPANLGAELLDVSARVEQIKLDHILKAPALGTAASLGDLLATLPVPLNLNQQRVLAGAMKDLRPDDPELAESIAKISGFDGDAVGVARTLRLGDLTGGHIPLAQMLQRQPELLEDEKGTLRPLAALRPDQWIDLAYTHGTPNGIGISPVAYADALAESIELQHPTAALDAHVAKGRRLSNHPLLADVGTFLHDNPDFDIEATNLNTYTKKAKLGGIAEPQQEQLVTGLRAIQRMRLLTASLDETATLFDNDLYSPHQLLAAGPGQLTTLLDGQIEPERVATLYSQAEELHTLTIGAFTAALSPLSGPRIMPNEFGISGGGDPINPDDLGGVGPGTILPDPFPEDDGSNGSAVLKDVKDWLASGRTIDPRRALTLRELEPSVFTPVFPVFRDEAHWREGGASVVDHNPTLQTLFGSQDACACGHCSSVLGPAAYFVDVLQFIKEANLKEANLLNRLLERRPDLQDLELSCNNTNTVVPAIDLALEILENAVALPFDVRLPDGTNVDEQLVSGQPVGAAVRDALENTVRNLSGEVRATLTRSHGDGTTDWTVIDGHRRWTLTAQPETTLKARAENGAAHTLDMAGLKPTELIATLDQKRIPKGAEPAFARLFAPNQKQPPEFANYDVTVTPSKSKLGHSWDVAYRFVAHLRIDAATNQLMLSSKDSEWSENRYNQKTIEAAKQDLAKNTVPKLVNLLVASRLSDTRKLNVSAVESGGQKGWTIASERPRLTLTVAPARLTITSLAYQSGDANADAIAEPENHNPEAYVWLKGDPQRAIPTPTFPWSLPVDLPLEEVRLFLDHARFSRRKLIELMLPVGQSLSDDKVFAREVLGLSGAEAELIGQKPSTADTIYACWGLSTESKSIWDAAAGEDFRAAAPLQLLKNVSILLQQSRLTFAELQAVLATRFVSSIAGGPLLIEPLDTCVPSKMRLIGLTSEHLDRMHRFIRLWRKLDWTMRELDLAIQAFGGQLKPDTLIGVASVQRLKEELELPIATLLGGFDLRETRPWTDYSIEGAPVQPSLYAAIFQNEALRSVSDYADFALRVDGITLVNKTASGISAHADYVGACLGIKSSVVVDWVSDTQGLGIKDTLTLANLSRLTAAANLCHALGMSAEKFTHHLKLYGMSASPFSSGMSAAARAHAMLEFVRRFRLVEQSGVEVETLRYLLQHYETPGSNAILDEKQLAQLASAARDAVHSIPDVPTELLPPAEAKDSERVEAALAIRRTNEAAVQRNREDAIIAALATRLSGARELVDDLLRSRLRHPYDPTKAAIDVFFSSSLFSADDFKDIESLVGQLRSGTPPPTQYVMKQFAPRQREAMKESSASSQDLQDILIAALNDLVQGASIYEASAFARITLSADTLALQLQQPTGAELARLNRQLLEETFPKHIRSTRPAIKTILVRLHKTVFLCDALTLGPTDLKLVRKPTLTTNVHGLTEMDLGLTALQFNSLPDEGVAAVDRVDMESFTQLEQLMALGHLRDIAPRATDLLHQYAALNPADSSYVKKARQVLAVGLLGSDEVSTEVKEDNKEYNEVKTAAEQLGITFVDQYRDPIILTRLIALLTALKQLGTTVAQAVKLTIASPDDAVALAARTLLRSKFGDSSWHGLIKPIADKLRTRQRDALVDYLIADSTREDSPRPRLIGNLPRLRDANDLYELYLIDVQIGSCLKTTRLLQATAAVQLFVQRVLLNLEKGLSLSADKRELWNWMHLYRVWEANRKVFLYPENWLLPELRDDKTATFRQMESALTEQEPSLEVTRAALMGYLDELSDLSQINVIAMYEDRQMIGGEEEGTLKEERTLHVVGRTPNQPYRYFWRSCAQFGDTTMSWSGWEVLDLDNANDFIMPFVMEGDLHVAWPIFRKTTDVKDKNKLMWEVQIAWTRRTTRGWIKRKLSPETLSVPRLVAISELRSFVFRVRTGEEIYEKNAIKPVEPDLTKQNSLPKYSYIIGSPFRNDILLNILGSLFFRNDILLNIRGQIAEHYTQDNEDLYRPIKARVTLTYFWNIDLRIYVDTDENGVFDFKSHYRAMNPTGLPTLTGIWAANNGKSFTLSFARHEALSTPFATRTGLTVAPDGSHYVLWEWDFTLIVELLQDAIIFDCYVADEKIEIKELELDLTKKDSPQIYSYILNSSLWNDILLTIRGQIAEHYIQDDKDLYRPIKKARVTLTYFHTGLDQSLFVDTDKNGVFDFKEKYTTSRFAGLSDSFTGILAANNGAPFTLTFARSEDLSTPLAPPRIGLTVAPNGSHYLFWQWDFTLIVELAAPPYDTPYLPERDVRLGNGYKSFVLETGRDMRFSHPPLIAPPINDPPDMELNMQRVGNRYTRTTKGGNVVGLLGDGELEVDHAFGLNVWITAATVPGKDPASPEMWHLQDDNARYYVRRKIDGWRAWPDGQEFVSWYRRLGAVSTSKLFDPATQAMKRGRRQAGLPATTLSTTWPSISFMRSIPYANYNWELFLHLPLAIADYLTRQQRFDGARRWLHAVFDPTIQPNKTSGDLQFWRFLPFSNDKQPDSIAEMLTWFANPAAVDPKFAAEQVAKEKIGVGLANQIAAWRKNPFMPHVIARLRSSAYQWYALFAYLDVLIGWGDQQFRRDTRESVNEATLLYVLAAKLLGPRPRVIPAATPPAALTYRLLQTGTKYQLNDVSNAWINYADLPGVKQLMRAQTDGLRSSLSYALRNSGEPSDHLPIPIADRSSGTQILTSLSALAFCIPQNDKLTEFYDRIEDRLFKVRNCRNIDGIFRELPLYEPPIDPLLLIRARAAGLDIDSVIAGLYAPLPHYRFNFTLQKALELAGELKALGGALLTALEKQDGEELTLLRSTHEIAMLKLVSDTRKQQQAEANIAALQQSEETVLQRFGQYQKLLGKKTGSTNGQDELPVVEQSSSLEVSTDVGGKVSELGLIRKEVDQLLLTALANELTRKANGIHLMAGILSMFPNIWAGGAVAGQTFGGSNLGIGTSATATAMEMGATEVNYFANKAGIFAGYERRQDEWVHQSKLALAELKQIKKQVLAGEVRKEIAKLELRNHETQIENDEKVDEFMRGKFSNKELYRWMSSQIAEVYFRTYQLALDQAKRAERTYWQELGLDAATTSFVGTGYWDNLKKGLMAGDRLYNDLKRMEIAYLNQNKREFELTKHISLALLNPLALVTLRETGKCLFTLPEELFDLDYPGHYFRRIKSVSLTLPCVVGPYATISCTLRLVKNSIRINTTTHSDKDYPHNTGDDSRFLETHIPVKAIATSGAQNDSGMFELSFRDERYLPFEGAGAISDWSLELFNDNSPDFGKVLRQFDYRTISDAILHVKYTAREDAGAFKDNAVTHLRTYFKQDGATLALRMFNLRQEFPSQWQRFLNPTNPADGNVFELEMARNLFPFRDHGKKLKVNSIWLLARCTNVGTTDYKYKVRMAPPFPAPLPLAADPNEMTLASGDEYGGLYFARKDLAALGIKVVLTKPPVKWQIKMTNDDGGNLQAHPATKVIEVEDVLLVLGYEWE